MPDRISFNEDDGEVCLQIWCQHKQGYLTLSLDVDPEGRGGKFGWAVEQYFGRDGDRVVTRPGTDFADLKDWALAAFPFALAGRAGAHVKGQSDG